jgi:hypothetical protein
VDVIIRLVVVMACLLVERVCAYALSRFFALGHSGAKE